jgi:hypothetical protein
MNPPKKLTSRQQTGEQSQTGVEQTTRAEAPREFATVEEMLRHDALHTPVPPAVAHRLGESLAGEPQPPRNFWQRLFRRGTGKENTD